MAIPAVSFPSVILGASPGIQAAIVGVVRLFLPSVILGASPGIQFFSGKHQPGFPPAGENDGQGRRASVTTDVRAAIGMNTAHGMTVYLLKNNHF